MVTIVVSIVAAAAMMMVNIVRGIKPEFIINVQLVHRPKVNSQVRLLRNLLYLFAFTTENGFYTSNL